MPLPRNDDGTLQACTWLGGYEIHYVTKNNSTLCHECANGQNGSIATEGDDDPQWNIVVADVLWEGPSLYCDHCNRTIESEYGNPNSEEGEL